MPNAIDPCLRDVYTVTFKGADWVMLGCTWDSDASGAAIGFALMTDQAGPDTVGQLDREPIIVPPSKWKDWLNPDITTNMGPWSRPGEFSVGAVDGVGVGCLAVFR